LRSDSFKFFEKQKENQMISNQKYSPLIEEALIELATWGAVQAVHRSLDNRGAMEGGLQ
jgi:hypothetical protein